MNILITNSFIEYSRNDIFTLLIQLINAAIYFYSFRIKEEFKFIKFSIISCVFFGIGYWAMQAWSGVIFSIFSIIYLSVSFYDKKKHLNKKSFIFFITTILLFILNIYCEYATLFIIKNFLPILSLVASEIHAYIYICCNINTKKARLLFLLSHTLLVIYEWMLKLPLFALVDICGFLSNIIELKKITNKDFS